MQSTSEIPLGWSHFDGESGTRDSCFRETWDGRRRRRVLADVGERDADPNEFDHAAHERAIETGRAESHADPLE